MGRKLLRISGGLAVALVLLMALLPRVAFAATEADYGYTKSVDWVTGTTTYTYSTLAEGGYEKNHPSSSDGDLILDFSGVDETTGSLTGLWPSLTSPGHKLVIKGKASTEFSFAIYVSSQSADGQKATLVFEDFKTSNNLTLSSSYFDVIYDGDCGFGTLYFSQSSGCELRGADASAHVNLTSISSALSSGASVTVKGALTIGGSLSATTIFICDATIDFSVTDTNYRSIEAKTVQINNSTLRSVGQIVTLKTQISGRDPVLFKGSSIKINGSTLYFDSKVYTGNVGDTVLGNSEAINIENSRVYGVESPGNGCLGGLFESLTISDSEVHAVSGSDAAIGPHGASYDYFENFGISTPSVLIEDSIVEAISTRGAAIGMPHRYSTLENGTELSITISGNSYVTATSVQSAAIGGAYYGTQFSLDGNIEAGFVADISGGSGFSLLSLWDGLVSLQTDGSVEEGVATSARLTNNCALTIEGSPTIVAKSGVMAVYAKTVTVETTNLVQNTMVTKDSTGSYKAYPMETPGEITIGEDPLGSLGYGYASVATTGVSAQNNATMKFGDAQLTDAESNDTKFAVSDTGFQRFFTTPTLTLSGTVKLVDVNDDEVTGSASVGAKLKADLSGLLPSTASSTATYSWYRNGSKINGANGSSYTLTEEDGGKVVYCVVEGAGSYAGSVTSNAVTVFSGSKIDAPTLEKRTSNSITLAGSCSSFGILKDGSVEWQESTQFTGLQPFTAYTFVQGDGSGNVSASVTIYTLPDDGDFAIDYVNETLSFPSGVRLYKDSSCSECLNQYSSTTRINISALIADTESTIYACQGKVDYACPVTIPARPSASVPDVSVTSDRISFTGVAGVTYQLLAGDNVVEEKTVSDGGNVVFSDLTPNTEFSLRARKNASNGDNGNFASKWSDGQTVTTEAAAPDAPVLSVKAEYVGQGYEAVRVGLSWTTPSSNGSTITGYTLTVTEQGASDAALTKNIAFDSNTLELYTSSETNLVPGRTYNFVLSAEWVGDAVSSQPVSCTLPSLRPDPAQFEINYIDETITVPENVSLYGDLSCTQKMNPLDGEQNVYTLAEYIAGPGEEQKSIYARYTNVSDSSALTEVKVPRRTSCSTPITILTTYDKIEIRTNSGGSYSLSLDGTVISPSSTSDDWITYQLLTPSTEYTLAYWIEATSTSFKSTVGTTTITTMSLTEIKRNVLTSVSETSRTYDLSSIINSYPSSYTYEKTGSSISTITLSKDRRLFVSYNARSSGSLGTISLTCKIDGEWYRLVINVTAVEVVEEAEGVFWVRTAVEDTHDQLLVEGQVFLDEFILTPRSIIGGEETTDFDEAIVSWTPDGTVQADLGIVDVSVYRVDGDGLIEIDNTSASSDGVEFKVDATGNYMLAYKRIEPELKFSVIKDGQDVTELQYGDSAEIALEISAEGRLKSPSGSVSAYAEDSSSNERVELGTCQLPDDSVISFNVGDSLMRLSEEQKVTIEYGGDENYLPFNASKAIKFEAAVPGTPVLTASEVVDGSVNLSWTVPSANGSEITGYTLNMTKDGVSVGGYPISIEVGTTHVTVNGLEPGSTYAFSLFAINSIGSSEAGAAEVFGGKVRYGIVVSSDIRNGEVISETDSASAGDSVSLQVTPNSGYRISSVSYISGDISTPIQPDDDGKYTFTMPAATVTVSATFEAIPPVAPAGLAAKADKRAVALTWDAPSGQPSVDHYELAVTKSGFSEPVETISNIDASATTYTVDGLEPGVTYAFTLTAVTSVGGRASANIDATVLAEYAVSVGDDITGGTVAASPTSAIKGETVTVTVKPEEGYEIVSVSYAVSDSSTDVSPVGGTYSFTMPAEPVTVTAAFKPIDPGAPANLTATPEKRAVALTWEAPDGDTVDHYELAVAKDGSPVGEGPIRIEKDVSSYEVTSLNPDTTYTFTLTAVTSAGGRASASVQSSALSEYSVTAAGSLEGGEVSADKESAVEGETVIVTVTPEEGYEVVSVSVTKGVGDDTVDVVKDESSENAYTFTMPAASVTVSATFNQTSTPETKDNDLNSLVSKALEEGSGDAVTIAESGTYQLSNNLNIGDAASEVNLKSTSLYIGTADKKVTVNLYLNGHSLASNDNCAIVVMEGSQLNLYSGAQDAGLSLLSSDLNDGETISGKNGLSFTDDNKNVFTYGGGVAVYGTLNMYGGSITDNVAGENGAQGYGGGVYVFGGGTFNMYGGSIEGNTASTFGGGVAVRSADDETPVPDPMKVGGATITGWQEIIVGDVPAELSLNPRSVAQLSSYGNAAGTFNYYGGSIKGNSAPLAGGVYAGGTVKVETSDQSTAPQIVFENSKGNLYVPADRTIQLTSAPVAGSKIGVTMEKAPGKFAVLDGATVTSEISRSFTSDNGSYYVSYRNDGLYLEVVPPTTYPSEVKETEGGKVEVYPTEAEAGSEVTITPKPDEGKEVDEVVVTDKDGNSVDVTDNGDGTWTFVMPEGGVTIVVTFRCDGGELCPSRAFSDVDTSAWYHGAIDWAIENGVLHGYTGTDLMGPGDTVTRAQMAAMLWNAAGQPAPTSPASFSDLAEGAWYLDAVAWAAETGAFSGYGDGTQFGPDDPLTREQAATVLMRCAAALGQDTSARADLSGYPDGGDVSSWASESLSWAVGAGVINGIDTPSGVRELGPQVACSRAQIAAILMNWSQASA